MANECTVTWAITVDKAPPMDAPITANIFRQLGNITSGDWIQGTVTASHTADTAVPLGAVAGNCGYFAVFNPSGTETVAIKTGNAGTSWAELRPGANSGLIPLPAGGTPYVRALGSMDVAINYTLYGR
jgi:hypothetical protein